MARFRFRLQRVLDLRRAAEEAARSRYLEAVARRLEAEARIEQAQAARSATLTSPARSLEHRLAAQRYVERLDDEARAEQALHALLSAEEEEAREAWRKAHQEVEAFEKLCSRAEGAWKEGESRREQAQLDEWSTIRRYG